MPVDKALQYQLMYQISRVTRSKGALAHDDRLDALSMGVAYWSEKMAQDVDKKIRERKSEKFDLELKKFMESFTGRREDGDRWMKT
jgi:hypothetical protein